MDDAAVNISAAYERPPQIPLPSRDPFFQPFLPPPERIPRQRQTSAGSGVIVDADQIYVPTNNHVVENGDEIRITLRDGRGFRVEVIGGDPATDIALLRIDADDLTGIEVERGAAVSSVERDTPADRGTSVG